MLHFPLLGVLAEVIPQILRRLSYPMSLVLQRCFYSSTPISHQCPSVILFEAENCYLKVNKNYVGISMGIALSLQIAFGKTAMIIVLILQINELGRYFHLLIFPFNFFIQRLEVFVIKILTCLSTVPQNVLYYLGLFEWCFPDFFFSPFAICTQEGYCLI